MGNNFSTDILRNYIESNEVVYQFCDGLIEVSNEIEKENKQKLLNHLSSTNQIEVYTKHNSFVESNWPELTDWSTDDDILFSLNEEGILICIPPKEAVSNRLITE